MTIQISCPTLKVEVEPLRQSTFSPFGAVIETPNLNLSGFQQSLSAPELDAVPANQGTALKYPNFNQLYNLYHQAASRREGKPVMTMFVCTPRRLRVATPHPSGPRMTGSSMGGLFDVEVLERHPFTTQIFIPMGLSCLDTGTRYLVIVAPTLPDSAAVTTTGQTLGLPDMPSRTSLPLGRQQEEHQSGMPDLHRIRAFLAHGSQAVTYKAGTWHAPMAVIGETKVTFVVHQFANGVSEEDCQEVELQPNKEIGVVVSVPNLENHRVGISKI